MPTLVDILRQYSDPEPTPVDLLRQHSDPALSPVDLLRQYSEPPPTDQPTLLGAGLNLALAAPGLGEALGGVAGGLGQVPGQIAEAKEEAGRIGGYLWSEGYVAARNRVPSLRERQRFDRRSAEQFEEIFDRPLSEGERSAFGQAKQLHYEADDLAKWIAADDPSKKATLRMRSLIENYAAESREKQDALVAALAQHLSHRIPVTGVSRPRRLWAAFRGAALETAAAKIEAYGVPESEARKRQLDLMGRISNLGKAFARGKDSGTIMKAAEQALGMVPWMASIAGGTAAGGMLGGPAGALGGGFGMALPDIILEREREFREAFGPGHELAAERLAKVAGTVEALIELIVPIPGITKTGKLAPLKTWIAHFLKEWFVEEGGQALTSGGLRRLGHHLTGTKAPPGSPGIVQEVWTQLKESFLPLLFLMAPGFAASTANDLADTRDPSRKRWRETGLPGAPRGRVRQAASAVLNKIFAQTGRPGPEAEGLSFMEWLAQQSVAQVEQIVQKKEETRAEAEAPSTVAEAAVALAAREGVTPAAELPVAEQVTPEAAGRQLAPRERGGGVQGTGLQSAELKQYIQEELAGATTEGEKREAMGTILAWLRNRFGVDYEGVSGIQDIETLAMLEQVARVADEILPGDNRLKLQLVEAHRQLEAGEALPSPAAAAQPPPEAKQPWEMTEKEYKRVQAKEGFTGPRHSQVVMEALRRGKEVPSEVLAEYPGLVYNEAPWMMTKKEWEDWTRTSRDVSGKLQEHREELGREALGPEHVTPLPEEADRPYTHKAIVESALLQGKPVPAEVLADYPDLAPPAGAAAPEAPTEIGSKPAESLEELHVDLVREWPADIPQVGGDFWTGLLDAARTLLTPARYKRLRQGVLGAFRPPVGEIELIDVGSVLTSAHELGHGIDWLMHGKKFPSSIKKRFPNTTVGERALRAELAAVSQRMRPDLWAEGVTEHAKRYARSHVELMGDFVSSYILDPTGTTQLAPNMTAAFEAELPNHPEIQQQIQQLDEARQEGPQPTAIAGAAQEAIQLRPAEERLSLQADLEEVNDYAAAAKEIGLTGLRHQKVFLERTARDAGRIRELVPSAQEREDLRVLAEKGALNLRTGKTRAEIEAELTPAKRKALQLYRGYQERSRQTVNEYLRDSDIAEYIKFIEDYFIHAYETPLTQKMRNGIAGWAKRSPQAQQRKLPTLEDAVGMGLVPRTHDLAYGLELWGRINYRVAANIAMLKALPNILNEDGESILQNPRDKPEWPMVDYWPIRRTYAIPIKGRGVLLHQGRVAVDPRVLGYVEALFDTPPFGLLARVVNGVNALWKGFQLTIGSLFHHWAEFHSGIGGVGVRRMTIGLLGREAESFGAKKRLFGLLPAHIGPLAAGKQLRLTPAITEDYLRAGGQLGRITGEGIGSIDRMLKGADQYLKALGEEKGILAWFPWLPVKAAERAHHFWQKTLWDNVERLKLLTYYLTVEEGLRKYPQASVKQVKEIAVEYVNNNYGGQEWYATIFRNPRTRWYWTNLMMSLDWTYSQIKTGAMLLAYGPLIRAGEVTVGGIRRGVAAMPGIRMEPGPAAASKLGAATAEGRVRRKLMRRIGRRHWARYIAGYALFTFLGNMLLAGRPPWENEEGHEWDVDWTSIWRSLPWNQDWQEQGDTQRRYLGFGKAGRELVRWIKEPLTAFGYKLSPAAREVSEQMTGSSVGGSWQEPWVREDLDGWEQTWERFKHVMENFRPFSLSGNNAFLAFPSRKGMTNWKARKAYADIYRAKGEAAWGGPRGALSKLERLLDKDSDRLMTDIAEACIANQVDAGKANREAIAKVRSTYYRKYWQAYKAQDIKTVEAATRALSVLGATQETLEQSGQRRGMLP